MKLTMMRIEYNEQNIILPDLRLINIFQNNSNYKGLEEMLDYYLEKEKVKVFCQRKRKLPDI